MPLPAVHINPQKPIEENRYGDFSNNRFFFGGGGIKGNLNYSLNAMLRRKGTRTRMSLVRVYKVEPLLRIKHASAKSPFHQVSTIL